MPLNIRLEVIPMVDIIFTLLIFFIVSSSLVVYNESMHLTLPKAMTGKPSPKALTVSIDADSGLFLNNHPVTAVALKHRLEATILKNKELQLIFQADHQVPYSLVISVLDLIRQAHCSNINLQVERTHDTSVLPSK